MFLKSFHPLASRYFSILSRGTYSAMCMPTPSKTLSPSVGGVVLCTAICFSSLHQENALSPMYVMLAGSDISRRLLQPRNVPFSICDMASLNDTCLILVQPKNAAGAISVTLGAIRANVSFFRRG